MTHEPQVAVDLEEKFFALVQFLFNERAGEARTLGFFVGNEQGPELGFPLGRVQDEAISVLVWSNPVWTKAGT